MDGRSASCNPYLTKTRTALLWSWILNTPFWAIYGMLPFILYKDLHATPLQIGVAFTLKPLVSLFAMYWSVWVNKRKDRLKGNVILAGFLGHLPFFFFPFVDNPWFFVASFSFYMLMARGAKPAWMEILKINIPAENRTRLFAYASAFEYLGGGVLPFVIGWLLDGYFQAWRWIFPFTALISIFAMLFQFRIPIKTDDTSIPVQEQYKPLVSQLLHPWRDVWHLLMSRPDFARFQLGFMLGGAGVMLMQPALPKFFMDVLNLSYLELAIALTLCKGLGYALTSPLWARWIHRMDIYRFLSIVTFLFALFPLGLLMAEWYSYWLYVSYIAYGIMQAGSELSWNLSGPIFAKDEDSSLFSTVNLLTGGLRGCIFPPLGAALCASFHPTLIMLGGTVLCLAATASMYKFSQEYLALEKA